MLAVLKTSYLCIFNTCQSFKFVYVSNSVYKLSSSYVWPRRLIAYTIPLKCSDNCIFMMKIAMVQPSVLHYATNLSP